MNNNKQIKKRNGKIKKILVAIFFIILNFLGFVNSVNATSINTANIYTIGDCGKLLTYKGVTVKVSYVEYTDNKISYPAYCLDKTKPGAEQGEYAVSVNEAIKDVGLWRRIVNGYPYKTIEELGVANKQEAFTATKQAVYCYIHGNNEADYGAIGEAGTRTLNAMKNIISNANKDEETKISSTITIDKNYSKWEQDKIDKKYISKTYNIKAGAQIEEYKITLEKEGYKDLGGIKLTDENNNEKVKFAQNEKFKIMIPIKETKENGKINIKVESKVKTRPILYGIAPNSAYQDYALTAAEFEDGIGNVNDEYYKNETKIVIIKKDQEEDKKLEGVEFVLLDENKEEICSDLKTNNEGKIEIENLIPGIYYIKETKTIDGYQLYDELIKVEIEMNQEITVTVNNIKEEKPQIETKKEKTKEIKEKTVRKLPVTGM